MPGGGILPESPAARADRSARTISGQERGLNRASPYDTQELVMSALSLSKQQKALLRAATHPEPTPSRDSVQFTPSFAASEQMRTWNFQHTSSVIPV